MRTDVLLIAGGPVVDEDLSVAENRIDRQEHPEQKQAARRVDALPAVYEYESKRQTLCKWIVRWMKNRKRFV